MPISAENIVIRQLVSSEYPHHREDMLRLYLDAFTTGNYAQYIDVEEAQSSLDQLIENGYAFVALNGNQIIGFLLGTSLSDDIDFPHQSVYDADISSCFYIAEVLVDKLYRGHGIATRLIEKAMSGVSPLFIYSVIRVWKNNKPALLLYQKLGFTPIATIIQTKFNLDNVSFEMEKVYLTKKL